jgi:hypothetical protein
VIYTSTKAQVFSSDISISIALFFALLIIYGAILQTSNEKTFSFEEQRVMREKAFQLAELMAKSKGYPENWNRNNVQILGFAIHSNILNKTKLEEFANMSYSQVRSIFNIPYEFEVNITFNNITYLKTNFSNSEVKNSASIEKAVMLNDSGVLNKGILKLKLWY